MIGSPSPSHPTVRAVLPSTAVRQSSSHPMHRFRSVLEQAAANGGEPHRLPLAVRKTFPPDPPALTALGQGPAQTDMDDTLQPTKSLAGVRVSARARPPRHERMHHRHACLRAAGCTSRREVLQAVPHLRWCRLGWETGDGVLPTPGTLAFPEVEA